MVLANREAVGVGKGRRQCDPGKCVCAGFVGGAIGNTGVGALVKKYKKTWFIGS